MISYRKMNNNITSSVLIFIFKFYFAGALTFNVEPQYATVNEKVSFTCLGNQSGDFRIEVCNETGAYVTCLSEDCNYNEEDEQCRSLWQSCSSCEREDDSEKITFHINAVREVDFTKYRCGQFGDINTDTTSLVHFKYSSLELLGDLVHKENDSFTLECFAEDGDPPSVAVDLSIDDQHESCTANNCSITIEHASRDLHGKEVVCKAYQVDDRYPVNISETLNITWPPVAATANVSEVQGTSGGSVSLNCDVLQDNIGNPHFYNYHWTRLNNDSYNELTTTGTHDIFLYNECWEDEYRCCPYNYAGIGDCAKIDLQVSVAALGHNTPDNYTLYYANDLSLNCTCSGKPEPNVEWKWNSTHDGILKCQITNKSTSGDCNLLTTKTAELSWARENMEERKTLNGKTAECVCNNDVDSLAYQKDVMLDVQFPPKKAFINSSIKSINVNNTLQLTCGFMDNSKGNPDEYQFQFHHGDTNFTRWQNDNQTLIYISSVKEEGQYSCNGRNKPKDAEYKEGNISAAENIVVYVIPEIKEPVTPKTFRPVYNETFSFQCRAIGKPNPNISLHRDDEIDVTFGIDISDRNTDGPYDLENESLAEITWKLDNIGTTCSEVIFYDSDAYTCVATNHGTKVHDIPSEPMSIQTLYPAIWNSSTNVTYAAYNHSANIVCDVCANPKPDFKWYKDGLDLEEGQVLNIASVSDDDFGSYQCVANNSIGSNSFVILFKEDGAPRIRNVSISETTSMSLTVTWIAYSHGGHPPVNFYISYRNLQNESYTEWSNPLNTSTDDPETLSETIMQLNANETYYVLVQAVSRRKGENTTEATTEDTTRAQPKIAFVKAELRDKEMTIKWTYEPATQGIELYEKYSVTVRTLYSPKGNGETTLYPPLDTSAVDASDEQMKFKDNDLTSECIVQLRVYENDIHNEFISGAAIPVEDISIGLGAGAISGIVLAVLFVAALIAVLGFLVYTDRLNLPFVGRDEDDYVETNDSAENPYEFENMSFEAERPATDGHDEDMPYMNINYSGKTPKPAVAPKPHIRKRVDPSTVPPTRMVDDDNCIYIRLDGLEFPKYKPPKPGQAPVIHGLDKLSVYASIDFTRRAPTPEPPEYDDEDVMGPLPPRPKTDEDEEN